MERLTIEKAGSILVKDLSGGYTSPCFGCESIGNCVSKKIQPCAIYRALEKLKNYEDLEEQGKLLKLPCAVGDTVYVIEVDEGNFTHFHCSGKISEYKFNLQMIDLLGMFGKCVFLTKPEAEDALKEMEERNGI